MTEEESVVPYTAHVIPVVRTDNRLTITLLPSLLAELDNATSPESRAKIEKAIGETVVLNLKKVAQSLVAETVNAHPLKNPALDFYVHVEGHGYALDLTDLPTLVAEEARKRIDAVPYDQDYVVIAEAPPRNLGKN